MCYKLHALCVNWDEQSLANSWLQCLISEHMYSAVGISHQQAAFQDACYTLMSVFGLLEGIGNAECLCKKAKCDNRALGLVCP